MDIPRTIDSIIQQRKQRLPEIDAAIQRLKKAHDAVELFKDFKSQLRTLREKYPTTRSRSNR